MGTYHVEKCHITGYETENHTSQYDLAEYFIKVQGKRMLFRFAWDHKNSEIVESNKHILHGLLLNGKFPKEFNDAQGTVLNNEILERLINDTILPKTPEEKLNHILIYLHSLQEFEGSRIKLPEDEHPQDLAVRLYFKNYNEYVFYLFTLLHQGFIGGIEASTMNGRELVDIKLTYLGLTKIINISESGSQSNRCFVAMSFSENQKETRLFIKAAISETGFDPILIDEQYFDSDQTINDALIAEIKKSKFVVADFSEHRHGVYFEAGFALGLQRPVIYLCNQNDFEESHFDTNHYPHIIYQDLSELKEKLKNKIEAWIK